MIQRAYNEEHGITPTSIVKAIDEVPRRRGRPRLRAQRSRRRDVRGSDRPTERAAHLASLDADMKRAAADLDFERAARLRDEIRNLRIADLGLAAAPVER